MMIAVEFKVSLFIFKGESTTVFPALPAALSLLNTGIKTFNFVNLTPELCTHQTVARVESTLCHFEASGPQTNTSYSKSQDPGITDTCSILVLPHCE